MKQITILFTILFAAIFGTSGELSASFGLQSSAFQDHGNIPKKYACDREGLNKSPGFMWSGAPPETKSYVLVAFDQISPDNKFIHWVIFNIPAKAHSLPEGVKKDGVLSDGSKQGKNSFKKIGYDGPCPPPGPQHLYQFEIYALDDMLTLAEGATYSMLQHSMEGHILDQADVVGLYPAGG